MTMLCPACGGHRPVHCTICRACAGELDRELAEVPNLIGHLDLAITRQTRMGAHGGGRLTHLPWDERARVAERELRSTLVGWARAILPEVTRPHLGPACRACAHPSCLRIDLEHGPADNLRAVANWLRRHRAELQAHPAADEIISTIRQAVRQARRAIDRPPGTWYAGPCGVDGCAADLHAQHGRPVITCTACRATHDAAAREAWLMDQAAEHTGTATELARALHGFHPGLTPEMIRGYAARLRLFPVGLDYLGRPLYRVAHVLALADGQPPEQLLHGPACSSCRHVTCKAVRYLLAVA
ncbi:hypothetical protein ACIBG7_43155 [Nonomuraea sp. NPDC050328]|uniref:hypothetical protein n=1 Tax=Nonomuraea sp. NPDC050328 TaxID=3364361 RepID=UPI003789DC00